MEYKELEKLLIDAHNFWVETVDLTNRNETVTDRVKRFIISRGLEDGILSSVMDSLPRCHRCNDEIEVEGWCEVCEMELRARP